ncbi:MAG: dUTP diphosphatase [Candidatus Saccharimonas sp.]
MVNIQIKKIRDNAVLPAYQTSQAAGMDLVACIASQITIAPHSRLIVPTGIAIALPVGYEAQVRGRSSLAAKFGVMPANGVGTIDADYRGEIGVILLNTRNEPFSVTPGMRIAQMVIARYEQAELVEVEELDETERGAGGYGSTGV